MMEMVSVITVDNTVNNNTLKFMDYIYIYTHIHTMIFSDKPMISFGGRKIDKKIVTFLELPAVSLWAPC
jgi:hypothetical protein